MPETAQPQTSNLKPQTAPNLTNVVNCETFIRLDHVTKRYEEAGRERTIFNDVSLDLACGEFVVLLGKSGSGKSTLLNLIGGIDAPSAGTVSINGKNITEMGDTDRTLYRRNHIGFIFQAFNLIPTLSVLENVMLPQELSGRPSASIRRRATDLIEQVDLTLRMNAFPDRLSGGEQQRVAIARALVNDPLVVLADEPTGNLDNDTGALVLNLLDTLTRKAGKNLVMVTHSEDVIGLADRVLRLKDGKLVESSK